MMMRYTIGTDEASTAEYLIGLAESFEGRQEWLQVVGTLNLFVAMAGDEFEHKDPEFRQQVSKLHNPVLREELIDFIKTLRGAANKIAEAIDYNS
jgi:hypothetical protein